MPNRAENSSSRRARSCSQGSQKSGASAIHLQETAVESQMLQLDIRGRKASSRSRRSSWGSRAAPMTMP